MMAVGTIYYSPALFDAAGVKYPDASWTYDTALDAAKKLTSGRGQPDDRYGVRIGYFTRTLLFSYGFQEASEDGRHALVNSPPSREAHQYWADLLLKHQVSPSGDALKQLGDNPFLSGRIAMNLEGTYSTQGFRTKPDLTWDVAIPPKGPAGRFSVIKGAPAHGLATLAKQKAAAWQFLSWWIRDQTADQVVNPGNLPTRKAALEQWVAAQKRQSSVPAHIGRFLEIARDYGKPVQIPPHSDEVWSVYTQHRKTLLAGQASVAAALDSAAREMDAGFARG